MKKIDLLLGQSKNKKVSQLNEVERNTFEGIRKKINFMSKGYPANYIYMKEKSNNSPLVDKG